MEPIRMKQCLAAAAACAALASCTAQPPAVAPVAAGGERQCFLASNVTGFNAVDADTVNVFVGANDVYSLDLLGTCQDLDFSTRVGIRSTGGSSWICGGADAELLVPGPMGVNNCLVTNIRKLPPELARTARRPGT